MIEVIKNDKESSASVLRRFTRKLKQSNVLRISRSNRYKQRPMSALKKKQEAIKRVKNEKRTAYLKKMGRIKLRTQ